MTNHNQTKELSASPIKGMKSGKLGQNVKEELRKHEKHKKLAKLKNSP
jgi:hypothetical protein